MSKHYALQAQLRERAGKGVARALRRENSIPAVIYGDKKEPVSISLPEKELTMEYHKGHMFTNLCDVSIDGKKISVIARDVQLHPVTDRLMHVDFLRVSEKTTLTVGVPVAFTNQDTCPGLKLGGLLNIMQHEVQIETRAGQIPAAITFDLSEAQIGDTLMLSQSDLPKGAKAAGGEDDVAVASIAAPRGGAAATEEGAEAAEEAAAE